MARFPAWRPSTCRRRKRKPKRMPRPHRLDCGQVFSYGTTNRQYWLGESATAMEGRGPCRTRSRVSRLVSQGQCLQGTDGQIAAKRSEFEAGLRGKPVIAIAKEAQAVLKVGRKRRTWCESLLRGWRDGREDNPGNDCGAGPYPHSGKSWLAGWPSSMRWRSRPGCGRAPERLALYGPIWAAKCGTPDPEDWRELSWEKRGGIRHERSPNGGAMVCGYLLLRRQYPIGNGKSVIADCPGLPPLIRTAWRSTTRHGERYEVVCEHLVVSPRTRKARSQASPWPRCLTRVVEERSPGL